MSHLHEKIDFTVEVFIVFQDKVLLRMHDKYHKWLSVGGHIELTEDPQEAAVREVMEEVGLEVEIDDRLRAMREVDETVELIPPFHLNRNRISSTHEHVTFVYFARAKSDQIQQNVKEEISAECKWFSKEELLERDDILPNIKFYAFQAIEKLCTTE